jgi:flagellar basal-body rod protein FlgG
VTRALFAAASGMAAQQQNLDVIADNLANADVAGFKNAQAAFAAIGGDASLGTASTGVHRVFTQGKLMKTGGAFDVAIDGDGFFALERDGRRAYTRAGSFSRAADGTLRTPDGWTLRGVRIPASALDVAVAANGRVTADLAGRASVPVGHIRLASFVAPERLRSLGSANFAPTTESGPPRELAAGGDRQPKICFGMLERSNVSTIESMMAILTAQRAYEANAKAVQASDEMLRIANNLHRS